MSESEVPTLPEMVEIWQQTLGWQPDAAQQQQFQQLYELILSGNRQLNLTRITAPIEFWEKHLWDSLRGMAIHKSVGETENIHATPHSPFLLDVSPSKIIDIGTGAGFPGIPVAIALPNSFVTLLDATRKKVAFLETLLTQLSITNATTLTGRAEQVGQQSDRREAYDIAIVRALGAASVCAEYALPLLKPDGLAILYRGQWTDSETEALRSAVEQLGGIIESIEAFTTPVSNSIRHCLYLRKVAPTPREFPRAAGLPAQKPL